jgi:hypothetical protein
MMIEDRLEALKHRVEEQEQRIRMLEEIILKREEKEMKFLEIKTRIRAELFLDRVFAVDMKAFSLRYSISRLGKDAHRDLRSRVEVLNEGANRNLNYVIVVYRGFSFMQRRNVICVFDAASGAQLMAEDLEIQSDAISVGVKLKSSRNLEVLIGFQDGSVSVYSIKIFKAFRDVNDPFSAVDVQTSFVKEFEILADRQKSLMRGKCERDSVIYSSYFGSADNRVIAVLANGTIRSGLISKSGSKYSYFDVPIDAINSWAISENKNSFVFSSGNQLFIVRGNSKGFLLDESSIGSCFIPSSNPLYIRDIKIEPRQSTRIYTALSTGEIAVFDLRVGMKWAENKSALSECRVLSLLSHANYDKIAFLGNSYLLGLNEREKHLNIMNITRHQRSGAIILSNFTLQEVQADRSILSDMFTFDLNRRLALSIEEGKSILIYEHNTSSSNNESSQGFLSQVPL